MARKSDRMSDRSYMSMVWLFKPIDFLMPDFIDRRVNKFGIREGMTLVDYSCGPGRYTTRFAKLVGEKGKVYAIDIHEIALEIVREKMVKLGLDNVEPILAKG
jgi:ubiquinone/menaquinone biosynthesis C-methylase UbiE